MTGVGRIRTGLLLVAASAALAACSGGQKGGLPRPGSAEAAPVPAQQFDGILSDLGAGRVAQARKALTAILKRDPQDARARTILNSIEVDPVAQLGAENHAYTVKDGETLQSLSERFLGTRDKFYALARYNDIAVPDGIAPGRVLKIPGEAPKPTPAPTPPKPRPVPPKPTPKPTPAPTPAKPAAEPTKTLTNPAMAARLRAAGLAALQGGNVNRAVGLLGQAARLDPGNATIKRDLQRALTVRAAVKARQQ